MHAKEKMYALAMMTLVVVGLMSAWASYSATATGSIDDIVDVAHVSTSGFTIGTLYSKGLYAKEFTQVFTISKSSAGEEPPATNDFYVRLVLTSAADNAKEFKSLMIKAELYDGNDDTKKNIGYLSLKNPEIILDPTGFTTDTDADENPWYIKLTVYGLPWKKVAASDITIECIIEPTVAAA